MLFIKAIDLVLSQIDAQLRKKLHLGLQDTLFQIEAALLRPLLSAPLGNVDASTLTSFPQTIPEPSSESKEPPAAIQSCFSSLTLPEEGSIDGELKFGILWSKFMTLNKTEFAKVMTDNLKTNSVASNKLFILFRLRTQLEKAKSEAHAALLTRDNKSKGALKAGEIDLPLSVQVIKFLEEADFLVKTARALSETSMTVNFAYKCSIGDTEILIHKVTFFLDEYKKFCIAVDTKTKREAGHIYALRDMSPHALKSKDFVIQSHIKMNEYILHNLDMHSQYTANQERQSSYNFLTSFLPGYDTEITIQKRRQIIDFFVALKEKRTILEADKASKSEIEEAILGCIDIHFGHVQSLSPSYIYSSQRRVEEYYRTLHQELMSQTNAEHTSKCLAPRLLKTASVA